MKRSGPLRRGKALRSDPATARAWEQRSRRALPLKSPKRRAEDATTAGLRAAVAARPCLLRAWLAAGACAGPGTPHHLAKASAGGATDPANLVPLCAFHNSWVEDDPPTARLVGLVVRPGIDHTEAARRRRAAGLDY